VKRLFSIVIAIAFLLAFFYFPTNSSATVTLPTKIKVGLKFDDPYGYTSLSQTVPFRSVSGINAKVAGVKFATFGLNEIITIIKTNSLLTDIKLRSPIGKPVTITPKPTSPAPTPVQVGGYGVVNSKYSVSFTGKFHVVLNHVFQDCASAQAYVAKLDSIGIYAFSFYQTSGLRVAIGGYSSLAIANKDVTRFLAENTWLKTSDLSVFNCENLTNDTSVAIKNENGRLVTLIYVGDQKIDLEPLSATGTVYLYSGEISKEYRGALQVFRKSGKNFTVINIVGFEDYLKGVVPAEIGGSSPAEALKSQAVASRTYAYNQMFPKSAHGSSGFDICATIHCHVYSGKGAETNSSNKAVTETAGEMVYYNGSLALVFYYSSNGGSTENVKYVWGSTYPYLVSSVDTFELPGTSNYTWTKTVTYDSISSTMISRGYDLGTINDVKITDKSPAGRAIQLQVIGSKATKTYTKESCRTAFSLPSQLFDLTTDADTNVLGVSGLVTETRLPSLYVQTTNGLSKIDNSTVVTSVLGDGGAKSLIHTRPSAFVFKGRGWGHAVGMSQNGAIGRAKAGKTYKEILGFYFPGTTIS